MRTAALLVMDFRRLRPQGRLGAASGPSHQSQQLGVLPRLAYRHQVARDADLPVMHARVAFDETYSRRVNRSSGFAGMKRNRLLLVAIPDAYFVAEAQPAQGEVVVNKGCVNPFIGTVLAGRLRRLQRVVAFGIGAHRLCVPICVPS